MKADSPQRLALTLLGRHKAKLAAAGLWRAAYVLAPMQAPVLTGAIVDGLTGKPATFYGWTATGVSAHGLLHIAALGLLLAAAAYGITAYGQMISAGRLSRAFVRRLRTTLLQRITYLSLDQHHRFGSGDLLDRTISDAAETRRFVERVFVQTLTNVLRVGYPVAMMFWIDPLLAFAALSILPPQVLLSRWLQQRLHTTTRKSRRTQAALTNTAKEHFDGIETIKSLHAEATAVDQLQQAAKQLEDDELASHRVNGLISGNVWLLTSAGVALAWWLGGRQVLQGEMTPGSLIVFTGFMAFAYLPFRQFTTIASTYRAGLVSLERIQEVLDLQPTICDSPQAAPLAVAHGRIEFDRVSFAYGRRPVLEEIDLCIPPRGLTAIVGRSGSGKSSLMRLMLRMYDPCAGAIRIDGQDIRTATVDSVRQAIAVVPQRPVLFSGSLLDNLLIGRADATQEEAAAACRIVGAMPFVERLEDGLDTRVGVGAVSLSGGEIQRLSIARAVLARPRILLMDEPTSALDPESETLLVQALDRLRRDMTIVLIAHRRETIRGADTVVVMDRGRIAAQGDCRTLAAACPLYQELFTVDEETPATVPVSSAA